MNDAFMYMERYFFYHMSNKQVRREIFESIYSSGSILILSQDSIFFLYYLKNIFSEHAGL